MTLYGWGLDYIIASVMWFIALNGFVIWRGREIPEGGGFMICLLSVFLGLITVVTDALLF